MTIDELSKYFHLSKQVKHLEDKITELELSVISSSKSDGMPHGTTISNPTEQLALKMIKLKESYENNKIKLLDKTLKIDKFLSSVDNEEIQLIIRLKFMTTYIDSRTKKEKLNTWEKVAAILGYERSTPEKKLSRYLQMYNKRSNDYETISN